MSITTCTVQMLNHDCNKHDLKQNQCINNYTVHVLAPYQTNQKLHSKRSKTNFTSNRGGRWNETDNLWQKQQQLLSPLSEHFNKTVTCSHHATTIVSMTNYHNEVEALRHQKHDFIKNELKKNFLRVKLDCL